MCGCEPGYTCTRCADTPDDPAYLNHDPRDDEQRDRERFTEGLSAHGSGTD